MLSFLSVPLLVLMLAFLGAGQPGSAGEAVGRTTVEAAAALTGAPTGAAAGKDAREIFIGAVLPLDGNQGMYGESVVLGLVTRLEEWNQANAERGVRVRLLVRDSHSDPDRAVALVREFSESTDPVVPVIIGPILSRAVRESEKIAKEMKRILVLPLGSTFEPEEGAVWTFRMAASAWAQARALARFMVHTTGRRRAAILIDPRSDSSSAYGNYFAEAVEVEGGEVVCRAEFLPKSRDAAVNASGAESAGTEESTADVASDLWDYREALRKIAAAKPDTLFVPCYAVAISEIIQAVAEMPELDEVRMCGPDTWDNQLVFDASGQRLIGSYFTSILQSTRTRYAPYQKFLASLRVAGVDQPDAQIACAYEAATMILRAIERSNSSDPEVLRQALLKMQREELATGVTSVTRNGMVEKPIVIRVIRKVDGWPTPVYQESIANIQPLPSQRAAEER